MWLARPLALLGKLGYAVSVAANGLEAVAAADARRFALILMDTRVPEMDGLEATRRIRASGGVNQTTPIAALTANAMASDRQACHDAGMDDFLVKPLDRDLLALCMAKWLGASAVIREQVA
jgi:CheY-like chemotaxis protein